MRGLALALLALVAPARCSTSSRRGGAWLVGGRGIFHDEYKSSGWSYDELAVALLGADGSRADWPLTALLGEAAADDQLGETLRGGGVVEATATVASDGAGTVSRQVTVR